MTPFLSILTPTYRRPAALARNLSSVRAQTAVADVEQVVVADHVGLGVGGMFRDIPPRYAPALHGRYVSLLPDDDALAGPDVVARVRDAASADGFPGVLVVRAMKMGLDLPVGPHWPPACGLIDLTCLVVRRDLWTAHAGDYGARYEGDYDFADALCRAGHDATFVPVLFAIGGANDGRTEDA